MNKLHCEGELPLRPSLPSHRNWAMFRVVSVLLSLSLMMVAGCTTNTTHKTTSDPSGPTSKVDTTEPGFDPVEQLEKAADLRDQLVAAGVRCTGDEEPRKVAREGFNTGAVAALDCRIGDVTVEISIYRSEAAKAAGVRKLTFLACATGGSIKYVDGDVWVSDALLDGKNESDPNLTTQIGRALGAPVRAFPC